MTGPTILKRHLPCPHCRKVFGRAEHLKRHLLIHTRETSFPCKFCAKTFVRKDALQRHEPTHGRAQNLLQRGARACGACASAKARCSGEEQCSRCRSRDWRCIYPQQQDSATVHADENQEHSPVDDPSSSAQGEVSADDQTSTSVDNMMAYVSDIHNLDFWEPGIMSSTNWLDGLSNVPFPDFTAPDGRLDGNSQPSSTAMDWSITPETPVAAFSRDTHQSARRHVQSLSSLTTPPAISSYSVSQATTRSDDSPEAGRYYVDGQPTRLSKSARRTSPVTMPLSMLTTIDVFDLQFPSSSSLHLPDARSVGCEVYSEMQFWHTRLCVSPQTLWPAFETGSLPTPQQFRYLVDLYADSFNGILPVVHCTELEILNSHSVLVLAMAAIGSYYCPKDDAAHLFSISLQEFLRRILASLSEQCPPGVDDLDRARLLHLIGSVYSGDERLRQHALDDTAILRTVNFAACERVAKFDSSTTHPTSPTLEEQWRLWYGREKDVRLAFAVWIVDSMLRYHFDVRQSLRIDDTVRTLPADDELWVAGSAVEWESRGGSVRHPAPGLREALSELYVEKRLPKLRSEFAHITLIHGLFHRSWEVESYYSDPFSNWQPVAERQRSVDVLPRIPIWLPSISTFAQWQNSACDVLDILHWQANAAIGQASGLEHPTVLHLHIARIVLLVPYSNIIALAKSISEDHQIKPTDQEAVKRWAIEHQYKARLAVIHAGVTLWHIRRHSINGFYEAPAVALATLTLWAFGTYSRRTNPIRTGRTANLPATHAPEPTEEALTDIILIDRPTDDELVQHFIRNGSSMKVHLSEIGDLYEPLGPQRVLIRGCRLLKTLTHWGVNIAWLEILQRLAEKVAQPKT